MCLMLGILLAWLILHLIAKSSASVEVILTVWWIVLMIGLLYEWMYDMEITTLFLMLAFKITVTEWGSVEALMAILSRLCKWPLISCFHAWKEKWFKKESMSLFSGENSLSKREKERRNLLHLLSMSINGLCNWSHCLCINLLRERWWWAICLFDPLVPIIDFMMWLERSKKPLKWNLPCNFLKWRCIGIKPAICCGNY